MALGARSNIGQWHTGCTPYSVKVRQSRLLQRTNELKLVRHTIRPLFTHRWRQGLFHTPSLPFRLLRPGTVCWFFSTRPTIEHNDDFEGFLLLLLVASAS